MEVFIWFVLTLIIAATCGWVAIKMRIPAGGMIGGMIGVGIFNLLWGKAYMYTSVRILIQICLGVMSGSRVGRQELRDAKRLIVPLTLMFVLCVVLNVVFGVAILHTTNLDISTALLSVTPGGATDMVFVAQDIGADTGMVGLLQSLRMIYCNGILPIFFVAMINKKRKLTEKDTASTVVAPSADNQPNVPLSSKKELARLGCMFLTASGGGLLFRALGIPGGTLVGSMLFTVLFTCFVGKVVYPTGLKRYQQVFTGAYIGISITRQTIATIPSVAVGILLIIVDIMTYVVLMSFILRKTANLDYGTSLLCSTPGGIGEVSILSEELGTDTAVIALFNTVRMILVVSTFPILLKIIATLI